MDNNQTITLGRNDRLTLDQDIYVPNSLPPEESIASVEDIQQALLNDSNFDPSELEATAAGGAGVVGDSSAEPITLPTTSQMSVLSFLRLKVSTGFIDGITDKVDPVTTIKTDTNQPFGEIVFSAPRNTTDDDYLQDHLSVEDDGSDNVKINVLDDSGNATGHSITLDNMSFSDLNTDNPLTDLLTKVDINNDVV